MKTMMVILNEVHLCSFHSCKCASWFHQN